MTAASFVFALSQLPLMMRHGLNLEGGDTAAETSGK
jgi:hypothetical protein